MDQRTLTALQGSIAKWQAIVDGTGTDEGTANCPLCAAFYYTQGEDDDGQYFDECFECPVYEHVGKSACQGTPLDAAAQILKRGFADTSAKVAAAQAELAFLQTLLPSTQPAENDDEMSST